MSTHTTAVVHPGSDTPVTASAIRAPKRRTGDVVYRAMPRRRRSSTRVWLLRQRWVPFVFEEALLAAGGGESFNRLRLAEAYSSPFRATRRGRGESGHRGLT